MISFTFLGWPPLSGFALDFATGSVLGLAPLQALPTFANVGPLPSLPLPPPLPDPLPTVAFVGPFPLKRCKSEGTLSFSFSEVDGVMVAFFAAISWTVGLCDSACVLEPGIGLSASCTFTCGCSPAWISWLQPLVPLPCPHVPGQASPGP